MSNLERFARRLRAVTAALAPTVGQELAEECARNIAQALSDGEETDVAGVCAVAIRHRRTHAKKYGHAWRALCNKDERRLRDVAAAAWNEETQ